MSSEPYVGKSAYRGAVAARYDDDRRNEPIWQLEQDFVRTWVNTLSPGTVVLDIPTGTGRFLEYLLARHVQVHAQDISEDMLAEVRRRFPKADLGLLSVRVGDAERLALENGSIDHVLCWRFFHLVPMPVVRQVLREFKRVSRGTVIVHFFAIAGADAAPSRSWLKDRLRPLWRRLRPRAAAGPATPWSHITSFSHPESELLAAFAEAGFAVERTHTFDPDATHPTRVYFLSPAGK